MKNVGERKMDLVDTVVENLIAIPEGAALFWLGLCILSIVFLLYCRLYLGFLTGVSMVNLIMI